MLMLVLNLVLAITRVSPFISIFVHINTLFATRKFSATKETIRDFDQFLLPQIGPLNLVEATLKDHGPNLSTF